MNRQRKVVITTTYNELGMIIDTKAEELDLSAQSKQLRVLANVLDGCPLTQPCDRLWKREGWCKEHCKTHELDEPDAECWLKYAEVMASDDETLPEVGTCEGR